MPAFIFFFMTVTDLMVKTWLLSGLMLDNRIPVLLKVNLSFWLVLGDEVWSVIAYWWGFILLALVDSPHGLLPARCSEHLLEIVRGFDILFSYFNLVPLGHVD